MKLSYLTTLFVLSLGVHVCYADVSARPTDDNNTSQDQQSFVSRLKGTISHIDYGKPASPVKEPTIPLKDSLTAEQTKKNLNIDTFVTAAIPTATPQRSLKKRGMNLSQAIELALGFHPDISSARANYRRAQANTATSKTGWYPKFSFDGGGGYSDSSKSGSGASNVGVTANQLLYDFGKTPSDIQYSKNKERQNYINVGASKEEIAGRVAEAFITVSRSEQALDAADDYIKALERIRSMISLRNSAGISDSADMILSQVRLDGVRSDRLASEASMMTARSTLSNLMGTQVSDVAISDKEQKNLEINIDVADIEKHPSIVAAKYAFIAAKEQTKYAKAQSYPSVGIRGSYSYDPLKSNDSSSLMLNVSGNIYVAGENKARVSAAMEDERAARLQIDSLRITQKNHFMSADESEKSAIKRLVILNEQLTKAREARDLYTLQYQLGKRPLFELLDSEQQVYSAALSIVSAKNDLLLARIEKAQAAGLLLKNLGIPDQ